MTMVMIKRQAAPELQGFAKNGNVATQSMTYRWLVIVNGKTVGSDTRLRDAKALAAEFGCSNPVIER